MREPRIPGHMSRPLTEAQRSVLYWVAGYFIEHKEAPTQREIAEGVEISTPNVQRYLEKLHDHGFIEISPAENRKKGRNLKLLF